MAQYARDTIVAAATPPGKGGIGIVRISGDDTEKLAAAMLGNVPLRAAGSSHFSRQDWCCTG